MKILYTLPGKTSREFDCSAGPVVIGRGGPGTSVDLDLSSDREVSRLHACLTFLNDGCWIEDLCSKHGTLVNGVPITAKTLLKPGDKLNLGQTALEVLTTPPTTIENPATSARCLPGSPWPPSPPPVDHPAPPQAQPEPYLDEGLIAKTIGANEAPADILLPADASQDKSLDSARRHLNAFYNLALALGTVASIESLAETVVQHIGEAFPGAERVGLLLRQGSRLLPKAHRPKGERPAYSQTPY